MNSYKQYALVSRHYVLEQRPQSEWDVVSLFRIYFGIANSVSRTLQYLLCARHSPWHLDLQLLCMDNDPPVSPSWAAMERRSQASKRSQGSRQSRHGSLAAGTALAEVKPRGLWLSLCVTWQVGKVQLGSSSSGDPTTGEETHGKSSFWEKTQRCYHLLVSRLVGVKWGR